MSIDPEMAWWADRRLGRQPVARQDLDDGGVRLTLDVTNVDAFIGWVLSFDNHAVVESPPEIRQQVIDRIRGTQ